MARSAASYSVRQLMRWATARMISSSRGGILRSPGSHLKIATRAGSRTGLVTPASARTCRTKSSRSARPVLAAVPGVAALRHRPEVGNCIEPSNVKARGKACPIRFQCADCGFYRPDPSYIPAIEEHLNSLSADREIASAMDAAPFVIDNLSAQIQAFRNVLDVMRGALEQLDAEHRDRVEQASAVLRKARAGAKLPIEDISRRKEHR